MTRQTTVLFGVGAAKAGTTWLFDHLSTHPDCQLRSIKELHYFDCVESGRFDHQIRLHRAKAEMLAGLPVPAQSERARERAAKRRDLAEWLAVIGQRRLNLPAYLDYLTGAGGERHLVADMTPAYGMLPVARLQSMATMLPDVRFVYLLRDPVQRLWSHVRMLARRKTGEAGFAAAAERMMADVLQGAPSGASGRGDYAGTITRLQAAVVPKRLLVMLMEDLMTVAGLDRLNRFLGIAPQPAAFDRRVHEGAPAALPEALRLKAAQVLRPQYDFVGRLFPDLPDNWRRNMGEVHG